MTEERFEELINLYLDNEIGRNELGELKRAIKDNLVRRRKFERACQLNQAARKALTSQAAGSGGAVSVSSSNRSSYDSRSSRVGANTGAISSTKVLKQKQEQASRNASVSSLVDRQSSSGAAATVEIKKDGSSSKDDSSSESSSGGMFPFFASTFGMVIGAVLIMMVICGAIYVFEHEEMEADDDSNANPPSQFPQQPTREQVSGAMDNAAKNAQSLLLNPDDVPRIQPDDNLLTGNSSTDAQTQSYMVSRTDTISASGNETSTYYMHVTQSTYVGPMKMGVGDANVTPAGAVWPQPANVTTTPEGALQASAPPGSTPTVGNDTGNSTAPIVPRVP